MFSILQRCRLVDVERVCFVCFVDFLASRDEVEYLQCWVEIELFKDLDGQTDLRRVATRIYDNFLDPESPLALSRCIDAATRAECFERTRGPGLLDPEAFDDVQESIFRYLNQDVYPRWRR